MYCQPFVSMGFVSVDSTSHRSKTVYVCSFHGWESADAEGQPYALFYDILHKRLVHPWILVPVGVLEPIPRVY